MNLLRIPVLFFLLILSACQDKLQTDVLLEPVVIAEGIFNGKGWQGILEYQYISNDGLNFTLKENKETKGCPYEWVTFLDVPFTPGAYNLVNFSDPDTIEHSIKTYALLDCGDAVFGHYYLKPGSIDRFEIDSINPFYIMGSFSATYETNDMIGPGYPEFFEFKNVVFRFEIEQE